MSFYKQDPNDPNKQVPNVIGTGIARYSHATCPAEQTIVKRPSYVTVNVTGVYAGGASNTNIMDYITIATASNAADFGDLLAAKHGTSGASGD